MSSDYQDSDITQYFDHENLKPPVVIRRRINGGADFSPDSPASVEAEVDIQQAGTMAPEATLILYITPDLSDASVLAGYLRIIEENRADIVTSSFGAFEALYGEKYNNGIDLSDILKVYDNLFKQGNAQGITFVASSGDSGGIGVPPLEYFDALPTNPPQIVGSFLPGVETPASSPHVTAVGGTNLITSDPMAQGRESTYVAEHADGDPLIPLDPYGVGNLLTGGYWGSGGGRSMYYGQPEYQRLLMLTNHGERYRTIPDVSLHMGGCPETASQPCGFDRSSDYVIFAGGLYKVIGTSTSAPAFAGLLALREQLSGRLGNANYFIYKLADEQLNRRQESEKYFHENIPGFNGYYQTRFGRYNLVLGLGSVRGRSFIFAHDDPLDCNGCRKFGH
jgi:subtilase family serine protease